MKKRRVMILGGTGMLGHVLLRYFDQKGIHDVHATCRDFRGLRRHFPPELVDRFWQDNVEADNFDTIIRALASVQPDVVINCIGVIKQLPLANDPLTAITVNAQLPHRISLVSRNANARMVHISTDCVFDGRKGMYTEDDAPCPEDLYGRTKLLGEVSYANCITLRTSIIGNELKGRHGLVEWFLNQTGTVKGYTRAIYSGFPTIELARIIHDFVLPNPGMNGIYHVSSDPLSKFDLLRLVAQRYGKAPDIEPYGGFVIDRSLSSNRFSEETGYRSPSWHELIDAMYRDYEANKEQYTQYP